jgi:hypothetical protein
MEVSMNLKTIIALAIAAAFALPAAAQTSSGTDKPSGTAQGAASDKHKSEAGGTAPGGFAGIDKNNDGYISRDEAKDAAWSNRFSELDKDNDGRLSQSEFDALSGTATGAAGAIGRDASSPSTTGGMGGSVGPGGTQSGSSTSGVGDKPGQKQ